MSAQKRLLSLLLALCMVLALVPAAFAEDGPAYLDPETEPSELMEEEAMGATTYGIAVISGPNGYWKAWISTDTEPSSYSTQYGNSVSISLEPGTYTLYLKNATDTSGSDAVTKRFDNIEFGDNQNPTISWSTGIVVTDDDDDPITVGSTARDTAWWTAFGGPFGPIPKGSKATMTFNNYSTTATGDAWKNWYAAAIILQNVNGDHYSAGYSEYGVLRMDNYGWNSSGNTIGDVEHNIPKLDWTVDSNWNWGTYPTVLQDANISLTIYHNTDNTIDVLMNITGNNETHYQNYTGITGNDDLYFRITVENAYITYKTNPVVSYQTSFNPSATATVTVYSDAERTKEVAKDNGVYYLANGTYYYTAVPDNTTLYDTTTGEFTVDGSATTSFPITVNIEMTQKAAPVGGYLYTSNADLLASLMWNIYFHIDENVIDTPTSAIVVVTSDNDETARGSYPLQAGKEKYADFYFITVPIRPRLIGEDIGLTLTYDGADYKLKMKESGTTEYKTVSISFSQYLDSVMSDAVKEEDTTLQAVVTALRAYQSALEARWPVSVEE